MIEIQWLLQVDYEVRPAAVYWVYTCSYQLELFLDLFGDYRQGLAQQLEDDAALRVAGFLRCALQLTLDPDGIRIACEVNSGRFPSSSSCLLLMLAGRSFVTG
jgi:hypothetical protein